MRLFAFQGIRYHVASPAGELAGPPYDQIDDRLRNHLHARRHHFSHLTRPVASATDSLHRAAAKRHRRWLRQGVLRRDSRPALYPYEIQLSEGGRRLGVCGLIGLEGPDSGGIRPHEATVAKTVDERLSLLRATEIDLEPILMLADDDGELNRLLERESRYQAPLVEHLDQGGNRHLLYRLEDARRIATYRQCLEPCIGLIADGHHRYTVAMRYAAELGPASAGAAGCKLAVITSLTSPGLRIDPIHRRLTGPRSIEPAARLASSRRRIRWRSASEIVEQVARAPQPSIAVTHRVDTTELWGFDPATAPDGLPEPWRDLAVAWLHEAILPELGLDRDAATDGTVAYRSNPAILLSELAQERATIGFWLPPMSPEAFARAVALGRLLPPKSTRFLPKVASGLVWATHRTELL